MIDKYLARTGTDTPTIDSLVVEGRATTSNDLEFINWIGIHLIEKFWKSEPEYADPKDLYDTPLQNGVYFNGKNIAEFKEQIKAGNIPFWKEYSEQTGITDPEELMQKWLDENGRTSYNFQRTPEEILAHQYLGKGGGCGEYVTVMIDVLRAAGIPTKVIFFLKQNEDPERDDITHITEGKQGRFGHYMGACHIDGEWRLFDFKWQWNPKFREFYEGTQKGIQHLNHRNNDGTTYVPATNNGIYTPDETLSSPNIGLTFTKDLPDGKLNRGIFAQDYRQKRS